MPTIGLRALHVKLDDVGSPTIAIVVVNAADLTDALAKLGDVIDEVDGGFKIDVSTPETLDDAIRAIYDICKGG